MFDEDANRPALRTTVAIVRFFRMDPLERIAQLWQNRPQISLLFQKDWLGNVQRKLTP